MLTFDFSDENSESTYVPLIDKACVDARKLLTNLPDNLTIKFTDNGAEDQTGVGGFAESQRQLNVAIVKNFHDPNTQQRNLRAVIFHELYHINQDFTSEQSPFTALESAVHEGCAVMFERAYGGGEATYANYNQHSGAELAGWQRQLSAVGTKYFEDYDTWQSWAFYHPELNQKWIIYKVGTWMMKKILTDTKLSVLDVQNMTAKEILQLVQPTNA